MPDLREKPPCPALPQDDSSRGRDAAEPADIPSTGWYDIVKRVQKAIVRDNLASVAAGLSMYAMLSFLPLTTAAVSTYAMFGNPTELSWSTKRIGALVPTGVWHLFAQQLRDATGQKGEVLGGTAVISVLLSLWSARAGMASLMRAANIAYSEQEKRSFRRRLFISLAFTAATLVGLLIVVAVAIIEPPGITGGGASNGAMVALELLRWLVLWAVPAVGLAAVYRYAPARAHAQWRWVTWGSGVAATLWFAGSILFTEYVRTIGSYGKSFGTLRDIVVVLLWLYLSSFTVVLGAVINAEMERQTRRDTTEGPIKPLGRRGAHAADTVGPSAEST
jgi:membrane protein